MTDDAKKIFNVLEIRTENDADEWDKRWNEYWKKGKNYSIIEAPFIGASYNDILMMWHRMGYVYDFSFCYSWKFRNNLPLNLKENPIALLIHHPNATINEKKGYQEILQKTGFRAFSYPYDYLSEEWVSDILRKHCGYWEDIAEFEFISVPFENRAAIVVMIIDICSDAGFSIFQSFQRNIGKDVPVIVASDLKDFDLMRIGQAIKMGAEGVVNKHDECLMQLEIAINDSMPTFSSLTVEALRKV